MLGIANSPFMVAIHGLTFYPIFNVWSEFPHSSACSRMSNGTGLSTKSRTPDGKSNRLWPPLAKLLSDVCVTKTEEPVIKAELSVMENIWRERGRDEEGPPRGFLKLDKLRLDPAKRELVQRTKIELLDHNEEYLAKHPQIEAVLRLILMELICHKPYDVRKFVKELLMSKNLETRVAKVILSKRMNLDRNHVREYFSHVAEWEAEGPERGDSEEVTTLPMEGDWPKPRPPRVEGLSDKPEYSHLHYYKRRYWLWPKEMMERRVRREDADDEELPAWESAFLLADYVERWGAPTDSAPSPGVGAARIAKERTRRRRRNYGIYKILNFEKKRKQKCVSLEEFKAQNEDLILQCHQCRKAVKGIKKSADDVNGPREGEKREREAEERRRKARMEKDEDVERQKCLRELGREWLVGRRETVWREGGTGNLRGSGGEAYLSLKARQVQPPCDSHRLFADFSPSHWQLNSDDDKVEFVLPKSELERWTPRPWRGKLKNAAERFGASRYQVEIPIASPHSQPSEGQE